MRNSFGWAVAFVIFAVIALFVAAAILDPAVDDNGFFERCVAEARLPEHLQDPALIAACDDEYLDPGFPLGPFSQ